MTEDELFTLFTKYPGSLSDRKTLVGLLKDMFPQEQAKINLLLNSFDIGIVNEIKSKKLDEFLASRLINNIINTYHIEKASAEWSVITWIHVYGQMILKKDFIVRGNAEYDYQRLERERKARNVKRTRIILFVIGLSIIATIFWISFMIFIKNNDDIVGEDAFKKKSNIIRIPFDSEFVFGKSLTDIYNTLGEAGFTNIREEPSTSGWLDDYNVINVVIGDFYDYSEGKQIKRDVEVIIKYSSPGRIEIASILKDYQSTDFSTLVDALNNKGLNNIQTKRKYVLNKEENQKIAQITINGKKFNGSECYVPKDAQINITYNYLQIVIGRTPEEFQSMNYKEAEKELIDKGFTNIRLLRSNDLVTGWFSKEGLIKSIMISGYYSFDPTASFDFNAPIRIVVHTYKNKGCEDLTEVENG